VAAARLLLRKASLTSVESGPKIFIIGDADRLVPQESSPEAANALLKSLEEPPRNTWFILTTSDPIHVLPTIRSRCAQVSLVRLSDAEVESFLESHGGLGGAAVERRAAAARGRIGTALRDEPDGGKARAAAAEVLDAINAGTDRALERALKQAPWQARGDFTDMLDALADSLSESARTRYPAGSRIQTAKRHNDHTPGRDPRGLVTAMERVAEAREAAQGNINPQLLLATLASDLREALCA
jgi:DNA polymerase-3 subunit delta'